MEDSTQLKSLEEALRDIAARLSVIEEQTRGTASLAQELPNFVAVAGDIVDEQAKKYGDFAERTQELTALAERLSRPETVRALRVFVDLVEQAPNTLAILADSAEEALRGYEASGKKLDVVLAGLAQAAGRSVELFSSPEFHALLTSPMFDRRMLETLGTLSRAVVDATVAGVEPLGFFGAVRAMGKAPVQRAVGLALGVAGRFGATLDKAGEVRGELPRARS